MSYLQTASVPSCKDSKMIENIRWNVGVSQSIPAYITNIPIDIMNFSKIYFHLFNVTDLSRMRLWDTVIPNRQPIRLGRLLLLKSAFKRPNDVVHTKGTYSWATDAIAVKSYIKCILWFSPCSNFVELTLQIL